MFTGIKKYFIIGLLFIFIAFGIDYLQSAPPPESATGDLSQLLADRIKRKTILIKKKDKRRVFDCTTRHRSTYPMKKFKINYFKSKKSAIEKTGFILSNGWPMLLSFYNYQKYSKNSRVFIGFRGTNWGVHKTPMTKFMRKFIKKKFNNDILLLPDSYLFVNKKKKNLKKDNVMVVCHGRTYSGGRYINSYWPGFNKDGSWNIIDRFFPENNNIYLMGWSNGASPRSQFLETKIIKGKKISFKKIRNQRKFLNMYSKRTVFTAKQQHRIRGVLDIETNYSNNKSLWNAAKFIKEFIEPDEKKLYYGTCSLYGHNAKNYVRLIKAFQLTGKENKRGFIRYTNKKRNIIIDLIALYYKPYYKTSRVNLIKETKFLKYKKKHRYTFIDHVHIVRFSLRRFAKLLKRR